jgi:hypothetical protein
MLHLHGTIPKYIYVSWKNKNVMDKDFSIINKGIKNLIRLNDGYEIIIYDDDDIENYLKTNLGSDDYNLIKNKYIVEKIDLWRLLIIYNEGGIFTDIDRYVNIPFSEVFNDDISLVLPTFVDTDFSQDIIISVAKNPILKTAIELNLKRRREGCKDIYFLGAKTYMHAVVYNFCGVSISTRSLPNKYLQEIREYINNSKNIVTYIEQPPGLTIFFDSSKEGTVHKDFKHIYNKEKGELYNYYNVDKWNNYTNK